MSNDFDDFGDSPPAAQPQHGHKPDLGSPDDAMNAGTAPAKFDVVGTVVKGVIVSSEMAQQRDIKTKQPMFWDDGNPRKQVLITLATEERRDDIDDDDGHRRVYIKVPSALLTAVKSSLGKTKLSEATGGMLAIKYVKDGKRTNPAFNAPKEFAAKFTPANGQAAPTQTAKPTQTGGVGTAPNTMAEAARRKCWEAFKATFPPDSPSADLAPIWRERCQKQFAGLNQADVTATEWIAFQSIVEGYDPAKEQAAPADSDIPF